MDSYREGFESVCLYACFIPVTPQPILMKLGTGPDLN